MQRFLVTLGIASLALGLLWPWMSRLGLGRLPGDIFFQKGGFRFYFPLTTGLVVSVILSLLLWLWRR